MYYEHGMWFVSGAHLDDIQGKGHGERGKENRSLRARHNNIVSGNSDEW